MSTNREWAHRLTGLASILWLAVLLAIVTAPPDSGANIRAGFLALLALVATMAAAASVSQVERSAPSDARVALALRRSRLISRWLLAMAVLSTAGAILALATSRWGWGILGLSAALVCGLYVYGERRPTG